MFFARTLNSLAPNYPARNNSPAHFAFLLAEFIRRQTRRIRTQLTGKRLTLARVGRVRLFGYRLIRTHAPPNRCAASMIRGLSSLTLAPSPLGRKAPMLAVVFAYTHSLSLTLAANTLLSVDLCNDRRLVLSLPVLHPCCCCTVPGFASPGLLLWRWFPALHFVIGYPRARTYYPHEGPAKSDSERRSRSPLLRGP